MNKGIASFAAGLLLLVASAGLRPASALTITGATDCDSNAVIRCGVANSGDLAADFQSFSVERIYAHFGISQADVNSFNRQAVAGSVSRAGDVTINGKIVATNAITAGRQDIPGSTAVTSGTVTFYVRPPSVSFRQPSLAAYVVMRNGRFDYAIIASCGNPVTATPVPKPKKPVAPPPAHTTPPPKPPSQTQTQTQIVTVTQPAVTTVSTPPQTVIPNTGPGNVLGIGGLVALVSGLGHFVYSRKKASF